VQRQHAFDALLHPSPQALARAKAMGQETLARQIQEGLAGYERAGEP